MKDVVVKDPSLIFSSLLKMFSVSDGDVEEVKVPSCEKRNNSHEWPQNLEETLGELIPTHQMDSNGSNHHWIPWCLFILIRNEFYLNAGAFLSRANLKAKLAAASECTLRGALVILEKYGNQFCQRYGQTKSENLKARWDHWKSLVAMFNSGSTGAGFFFISRVAWHGKLVCSFWFSGATPFLKVIFER